jgi:hypothetical protein
MWQPARDQVSSKETVGRRVFESSPFFERNGKVLVKFSIFLETRRDEEGLSFDRLGIRERDFQPIVAFLTPMALSEAVSRKPSRPFTGWIGIRVKNIRDLRVRPDPIDVDPKNPYHALLPLDQFREKVHADNLAFRLASEAEDDLIAPAAGYAPARRASSELLMRWREWLSRLIPG